MDDQPLASGALSLEGNEPVAGPPVGQAPAVSDLAAKAAEPAPEPVVEEPDPADVVRDSFGRKLVPLEALQAARDQAKAAKALQVEVEQLRGQAQSAQQVTQWVEQVKPLLAKLKDRPDLVQAALHGTKPAGPDGAPAEPPPVIPDEAAADLARTLELYTPTGDLDLKRARKVALLQRQAATEAAEAASTARMAPFEAQADEAASAQLFQQYATMQDKHGRTVNRQVLKQMWQMVPPALLRRDTNVGGVLFYAAHGYAGFHGLEDPTPSGAPVVTESPGGGRPAAPVLTEFDRRVARAAGTTEKAYTETAARYRPGGINLLE